MWQQLLRLRQRKRNTDYQIWTLLGLVFPLKRKVQPKCTEQSKKVKFKIRKKESNLWHTRATLIQCYVQNDGEVSTVVIPTFVEFKIILKVT